VDKDRKKEVLTFHKDVVFQYSVCMSCKFFASYCIDSLSDKCMPPSSAAAVATSTYSSRHSNSKSTSRCSSQRQRQGGSGSKRSLRDQHSTVIVRGDDGSFSAQAELTWKEDTSKHPQRAAQVFARYIDNTFYLHPDSRTAAQILKKVSVEGSSRCITTGSPTGTDSGGDVSACWCCGQFTKGMVWIRFVNMLTYPYPVRKFRMLLQRKTTVGELLAKLKSGVVLGSGERITLQYKGRNLDLDENMGIIKAGLSRYTLIAISKQADPEALAVPEGDALALETAEHQHQHTIDQNNKQFVGELLFGHLCGVGGLYRDSFSSERREAHGQKLSIVETSKMDVGFRVLSLLLQDLIKKSVLCSWHRERIAHWNAYQLALVLEREEEKRCKKKEKKLKKRTKEKERKLRLEESKQRLKRPNRIIATTTNTNTTHKQTSPTASEERTKNEEEAATQILSVGVKTPPKPHQKQNQHNRKNQNHNQTSSRHQTHSPDVINGHETATLTEPAAKKKGTKATTTIMPVPQAAAVACPEAEKPVAPLSKSPAVVSPEMAPEKKNAMASFLVKDSNSKKTRKKKKERAAALKLKQAEKEGKQQGGHSTTRVVNHSNDTSKSKSKQQQKHSSGSASQNGHHAHSKGYSQHHGQNNNHSSNLNTRTTVMRGSDASRPTVVANGGGSGGGGPRPSKPHNGTISYKDVVAPLIQKGTSPSLPLAFFLLSLHHHPTFVNPSTTTDVSLPPHTLSPPPPSHSPCGEARIPW
jgi:hypothetical protein